MGMIDDVLNAPVSTPTYTGPSYAAPAGSPAAQSAAAPPPQDAPPDLSSIFGSQQPSAPLTSSPTPDTSAASVLGPQQVSGPKLKGMLQRFAYGFGQAAMKEAGLPTDFDIQKQNLVQQQVQSEIQQRKFQQSQAAQSVTLPNGVTMPMALAQKVYPAIVAGQSRENVADTRAQSASDIARMNNQFKAAGIGMVAEQDANGRTTLRPMTADEQSDILKAKAQGKPNEIQLIQRAQSGDKDAQKTLDTLQQRKLQLGTASATARGKAFGMYRTGMYYDPDLQQTVPMFQGDAMQEIANGRKLIPTGQLPGSTILGAQRLSSEAQPALKGVQDNIAAFDNAGDRAIFARILKENPMADGQDPHSWMGNILDQSLNANLSPQGKNLVVKLNRLNETVSLLRSTLGLPASNGATALTLRLIPGAATPDSKFAKQKLDELNQVVQQSFVPALGGSSMANIGNGTNPSPTAGGKTLDAATAKTYFEKAGGNAARARALAKADGYKF